MIFLEEILGYIPKLPLYTDIISYQYQLKTDQVFYPKFMIIRFMVLLFADGQ